MHSREALRDGRAVATTLLVFGSTVTGLVILDLLLAGNATSAPLGAVIGTGVLAQSLPLVALIGFAGVALVNTAVPLTSYRQSGVLRQLGTTPVSKRRFIVAHIPVRLALGIAQIVLIVVLAALFTGPALASLVRATVLTLLVFLMLLALGYLIGARSHDPDRTMNVSYALTIALVATSGTVVPLASLPEAISTSLAWLPTSLFAQGFSAELLGTATPAPFATIALVLTGITATLFCLSFRAFRWE